MHIAKRRKFVGEVVARQKAAPDLTVDQALERLLEQSEYWRHYWRSMAAKDQKKARHQIYDMLSRFNITVTFRTNGLARVIAGDLYTFTVEIDEGSVDVRIT